jgi:hypothetical protein
MRLGLHNGIQLSLRSLEMFVFGQSPGHIKRSWLNGPTKSSNYSLSQQPPSTTRNVGAQLQMILDPSHKFSLGSFFPNHAPRHSGALQRNPLTEIPR